MSRAYSDLLVKAALCCASILIIISHGKWLIHMHLFLQQGATREPCLGALGGPGVWPAKGIYPLDITGNVQGAGQGSFDERAAKQWTKKGTGVSSGYYSKRLAGSLHSPGHQHEDDHEDNQSRHAAWVVPPGSTIWPGGQDADQSECD